MARKMMNTMAVKKKCSCSIGKMIAGVIIMAAGLYAIVQGFQMQSFGEKMLPVFLLYVVGIFLIAVGKFFKMSSYMCCEAHNLCK